MLRTSVNQDICSSFLAMAFPWTHLMRLGCKMFVCYPAGLGTQSLNSDSYYVLILKCPVSIDSGSYTLKAAFFHIILL